jgi:Protein of unknown function (DUF3102)
MPKDLIKGTVASPSNLNCVLDGLAERINNAADASLTALRSSFEHACEAGQLLIEAKALVGHGGWSAWLADNTKISERTAQRWMRFARKGREAVVAKTDTVAVLTSAAMDAELHLCDEKVHRLTGGTAEMTDCQIELDEIDRSQLRIGALRARRKAWLAHAEEPPTRERLEEAVSILVEQCKLETESSERSPHFAKIYPKGFVTGCETIARSEDPRAACLEFLACGQYPSLTTDEAAIIKRQIIAATGMMLGGQARD